MTGRDRNRRPNEARAAAKALAEERTAARMEGADESLASAVMAGRAGYVVERGEPFLFPTIAELTERMSEAGAELIASFDPEELHFVASRMPKSYACIGHDVDLEVTIRGYECDGAMHPVPVWAPKGTAVTTKGVAVETTATLDELLDGGVLVDGLPVVANALYMFESYCFHPDASPQPDSGAPLTHPTLNGNRRSVVTLDTGRVPVPGGASANIGWSFKDGGIDTWPADEVSGHGPAIADLIGTLVGVDGDSYLAELSPGVGHGLAYQLEHDGEWYRAFDSVMLLAALQQVEKEYGHCPVLNLSLGRAAVPADVPIDPVWNWIRDVWLASPNDRFVVAAAGNHGTCVPNFPAALFTDWSAKGGPALPQTVRERVFSVGSDRAGGFSGYADPTDPDHRWVRNIRRGHEVPITHHNPKWKSWTGTSFAAPQVSAELATGNTPT